MSNESEPYDDVDREDSDSWGCFLVILAFLGLVAIGWICETIVAVYGR
ncbi:hypothetical protein [Blastopirellula retiformator]|uniref:Uncharacterized protein n=1 Tax=Blastopirellula retiformator TaxID=2527970 RepID=A0A5C5VJC0_9BACT|nr:hypothetical protein [Blastopirellula retiformator]TWT38688.1 hypothetical protein Enr8_03820 [Blastopirellula retiformator]